MCNLTTSTKRKLKGYKVVAKKWRGKRYYSIAMGFKYPLDGHVPVVRKQRRICSDFMSDITLENSGPYREEMIGRTAIFLNYEDAYRIAQRTDAKSGYRLIVVQSEVSEDVMTGTYLTHVIANCKVAAGRHIRFIKEMTLEG